MIGIAPFVEPRDAAALERAGTLRDAMQALLERVSSAGNLPANRGLLLTRDDRRSLAQLHGKALARELLMHTERVNVMRNGQPVECDVPMAGFTPAAFDRSLYAGSAMRDALRRSQGGRCAYCESLPGPTSPGEVDHFRPVTGWASPESGPTLFRPGYPALAYDPANLLFACSVCSRAFKRNTFAVLGPRAPEVDVAAEHPVLPDPRTEDPRELIRFNPKNGQAYAFDLAAAFHRERQGWSTERVQQELWRDAGKIPAQFDHVGTLLTHPEVDEAFRAWVQQAGAERPRRGQDTIATLGLNRDALVRSRIAHLRQLRGLAWSAVSDAAGADRRAAAALIAALADAGPAAALPAPQYVSLGIDAVMTWRAAPQPDRPWIEVYGQALTVLADRPDPDIDDDNSKRAELMLMLLRQDGAVAGRRRLVRLSRKDAVYGRGGQHAVLLPIDWARDSGNAVSVERPGKPARQLVLREFIEPGSEAVRQIEEGQAWIHGDYPLLTF